MPEWPFRPCTWLYYIYLNLKIFNFLTSIICGRIFQVFPLFRNSRSGTAKKIIFYCEVALRITRMYFESEIMMYQICIISIRAELYCLCANCEMFVNYLLLLFSRKSSPSYKNPQKVPWEL